MTTIDVAYNEGWDAADRVVDVDENPYNPMVEPELNREWRRGWEENSPGGARYERNTSEREENNMSSSISIAPTWINVLPILVEVAVKGETMAARSEAWAELRRMARIADDAVAEKTATTTN